MLAPISKVVPLGDLSPSQVLRALPPEAPAAIWETGRRCLLNDGTTVFGKPRYSCLVISPKKVVSLMASDHGDPIAILREHAPHANAVIGPEPIPTFCGGVVGFLSYDAARRFEHIKGTSGHSFIPDLHLFQADKLLVFDREEHCIYLLAWPENVFDLQVPPSQGRTNAEKALHSLEQLVDRAKIAPGFCPKVSKHLSQRARFDKERFVRIVKQAKDYLVAGDAFQIVLGNEILLSGGFDALEAYDRLCQLNPSPYHFMMRFQDSTLLGASPEVMLRGFQAPDGYEVAMRLVAGTYQRSANGTSDLDSSHGLTTDEKERAEHLMLIDHARNDIGRVSRTGSVKPTDLFSVETYRDIHHLVSQVSGVLRENRDVFDALQSCFPIATLTGTPKIRAMEIIAELEGPSRGAFGGTFFVYGLDGSFDSTVIIRSTVVTPSGAWVSSGAGIVYDSAPEREWQECGWKAKSVIDALTRE